MQILRAAFLFSVLLATVAPLAVADLCLIVYPEEESIYFYKASRYYTVGREHPLYDAEYDRGGEVLIEAATDEIAYEIYRANVVGFFPAEVGPFGYRIGESPFHLVIEALADEEAVYTNILLAFLEEPLECDPIMTVDGVPVVGKRHPVGDLVVDTPDGQGGYAGQITVEMTFLGCPGLSIWAFSDENGDLVQNSGECTSSFLYHVLVPVEESSFSEIKSLY